MTYNYDNIKYHLTGMSTINSARQEGLLLHLQKTEIDPESQRDIFVAAIDVYLDKTDCLHIAKSTYTARHQFWSKFKLPRMSRQRSK